MSSPSAVAAPSYSSYPLLRTSIRLTTALQSLTALSFTTFLVLHLSAPLSALVGGESAANGVMLVGREVYQGEWVEVMWVYGSAVGHLLSGVVGRGLKRLERGARRERRTREVEEVQEVRAEAQGEDQLPTAAKAKSSTTSTQLDFDTSLDAASPLHLNSASLQASVPVSLSPSPSLLAPFTLHHLTGYLLLLPLYQHLRLHRFLPLSHSLDTIFSYSFVSHSLRSPRYRLASVLGYATLTGLTAYHALVGIRVLWDPTAPRGLGRRRRERSKTTPNGWQVGAVGIVLGVGLGAVRIATSAGKGPEWIARKFDRVLSGGWGY